jgi:MSHA pilin protein MshA
MSGAAGIVYGKAAIDGNERVENLSADLATASAAGVAIHYGYPTPTTNGIVEAVVGLKDDWSVSPSGATQLVIRFPSGAKDECNVVYTQAADENTPPTITAASADNC